MDLTSFRFEPDEIKNSKAICPELLEDIVLQLAIKNQEQIESCECAEYIWSTHITELVFNICKKYKLRSNVKYLALEIYQKFNAAHIVDVRQKYSKIKNKQKSDWEVVESKIEEQSVLRLLTSVQLASKMESHEHLFPDEVEGILKKSGSPFSLDGIFSSEMRVLQTLNYKVNFITPGLCLELLLYVLRINDTTIDEDFNDSIFTVLDFVYLHRTRIYDMLYAIVGGEGDEVKQDFNPEFLKVKADYILLSASVITAATCLFMNQSYDRILDQLHHVTGKVEKDIQTFGFVIAFVVQNDIAE